MTTLYHVHLPHKMVLEVEIADTPINMSITFSNGKKVMFSYAGATGGQTATATPVGLDARDIVEDRSITAPRRGGGPDLYGRVVSESPGSAAAIAYIDPEGSQM